MTTQPNTELTQVSKALADMDAVSVGLATLRDKFGGVVYEVATTQGMTDAKAARAAIREPRYSVESIRKEAKAPILALGKKLDAEAKRITDELLKIEDPIQEQIVAEEARKEREKEARIAAELQRVQALQDRVAELRGNRTLSAMSGSALIAEHISDLERIPVNDTFQEFEQQAQDAKASGLSWLREVHGAAVAHEAEQARIQAEREELARHRAEAVRREAEERARREAEEVAARKARQEEERRAAEQRSRQKAEDDRIAAERRAVLAAQEAEAAVAREAETTRLRLEREAHDAQLRTEREAQQAAAAAERERIATERADLERQQAALRKVQAPTPVAAPSRMRPKAEDLVAAISNHFQVKNEVALRWLRSTDFAKASEAA